MMMDKKPQIKADECKSIINNPGQSIEVFLDGEDFNDY